ncbi:dTDP-4-dehydrorhamnose 3,5-epimerase family protein [Fodinicola acaciae]|uniref:dTDP-4-dehydrorhamnose 3,5-epimerase family protein n=1 Tax=Fodinicola acaciae TaxID=2681555 RepID=UPI0013D48A98|nr:dTDP-4-dehydrorhamnose 3,5-epimerase family protein [Fodinicola acaciae]
MKIIELDIPGAYHVIPERHTDSRGSFFEWYRFDLLSDALGHPFELAQANISVSAKDVVRGVHFADTPPGQAKYVSCFAGAVMDVVVDVRVGSPTFGQWSTVRLDDEDRCAVYLSEGLGHAFCALTENATVMYLCSQTYAPRQEHTINPLDPKLAIGWPTPHPILSERDAAAQSLSEAAAAGVLPDFLPPPTIDLRDLDGRR